MTLEIPGEWDRKAFDCGRAAWLGPDEETASLTWLSHKIGLEALLWLALRASRRVGPHCPFPSQPLHRAQGLPGSFHW